MARKYLKTGCFSLALLTLPLLTGCEALTDLTVKEDETTIEVEPVVPQNPDSSGAVCNPFGGGVTARDQGLLGELYHLPSDLPRYQSVSPYIQNGSKLEATLYFDQVNVPTRPFDAGFTTLGGDTLKTPAGDTLYEWFALRFDSVIKLTNNDRVGKKQFALLADDGAILRAKVNGQWINLVDDDGQHPTKFKIASTPIELNVDSELPIELKYFQGPRMHIAVMVLWREWPEGHNAWRDSYDGQEGNDLFFDSNVSPSAPQSAYQTLLSRGWKPVPAANYFLPSQAAPNPCPEQEVPNGTSTSTTTATSTATETSTATATNTNTSTQTETETSTSTSTGTSTETDPNAVLAITGFDGTTTTNSANLIWQTNGVPSSTKVYWGTSSSNLNQSANLGSGRTTLHQIEVTGLNPATAYYFRAESTDANGRTVTSSLLLKATK
jgi:hypothetical protein